LLEARAKRDDAKKLLINNRDPNEIIKLDKAEKQANNANTFELCANQWLEHWRQ
jgi:hypothetical protein